MHIGFGNRIRNNIDPCHPCESDVRRRIRNGTETDHRLWSSRFGGPAPPCRTARYVALAPDTDTGAATHSQLLPHRSHKDFDILGLSLPLLSIGSTLRKGS